MKMSWFQEKPPLPQKPWSGTYNSQQSKIAIPDMDDFSSRIPVMAKFIIGAPKAEFLISKEAVCKVSPGLRAAFGSIPINGASQAYTLPDLSVEAFLEFKNYVEWKGTGDRLKIHAAPGVARSPHYHREPCTESCFARERVMVELWVLGEKLKMPKMQNAVVDCLMRLANHHQRPLHLDPRMCTYLCFHTARGSALRLFVVAQQAAAGRDNRVFMDLPTRNMLQLKTAIEAGTESPDFKLLFHVVERRRNRYYAEHQRRQEVECARIMRERREYDEEKKVFQEANTARRETYRKERAKRGDRRHSRPHSRDLTDFFGNLTKR